MTEVFNLHGAWMAIVDGILIAATFNCKGAALAAIPVERSRRIRKQAKG